MDAQTLEWLGVVYGKHGEREYDPSVGHFRYQRPPRMDDAIWARLQASRHPPNAFERITHDEAIDRILAADRALGWAVVLEGFVTAVSGRWPRGGQSPISAAFATNLEPHAFHNPDAHKNPAFVCHVCGLAREEVRDRTLELYAMHHGGAWNEMPCRYVFDLEEWPELEPPGAAPTDWLHFRGLLEAIDAAPPKETPGALAKRLGRAHFPGSNKYSRYGLLSALAELGVLRSPVIDASFDRLVPRPEVWSTKVAGSARSDIPLPLGAWRGANGVDWDRVGALFPEAS